VEEIRVGSEGLKVNKGIFNFKLLLLDDTAQKMVAPVAKIGFLREHNITLHLNISNNKKREAVPEVAALYLVEPVESNFQRIA